MNSPFFGPEDLVDLGMALRDAGFNTGPDQHIAAQRLIVSLAAEGMRFNNRRELGSWLAPIFCATPSEQSNFSLLYDDWLSRRGELPAQSTITVTAGQQASAVTASKNRKSRLNRSIAALFIVALGLGLLFGAKRLSRDLRNQTVYGKVVNEQGAVPSATRVSFRGAQIPLSKDGYFTLRFRLLDLPAKVVADNAGLESTWDLNSKNYRQPILFDMGSTAVNRSPNRIDLSPQEPLSSSSPDQELSLNDRQRIYRLYYPFLLGSAASIPLVLIGVWMLWIYLPRLHLVRWKSDEKIDLDSLRVQGSGTQFFTSPGFRRITQQLRRHRLVKSMDLDADRTVVESAAHGGWFAPVYLWQKRLPDYLVLIDRAGFRDFQSRLIDDFVANLRAGRVEVDSYHFYSDPRTCYREMEGPQKKSRQPLREERSERSNTTMAARYGSGRGPASVLAEEDREASSSLPKPFSLEDLIARHPNHNLFIVSDAAGFFSSFTSKLQPWVEQFSIWNFRALFVSERMISAEGDLRARMLEDAGFLILSATESGLSTAVDVLDGVTTVGDIPHPTQDVREAYPVLLKGNDLRWLSEHPPRPSEVSLLLGQLRAHLGQETFAWFCACAVYPNLQWDLTLYLGHELNVLGPDEKRLALLLRLPWFRHGSMPDWLRERLVRAMPSERREAVRDALWRLLYTALERPLDGFELTYAKSSEAKSAHSSLRMRWLRHLISNFIRTEPPQGVLRDYLLLSVLHRRTSVRGFVLPDRLRQLWGSFGQPHKPVLQIGAALLVTAGVIAGMLHYRPKPFLPAAMKLDTPERHLVTGDQAMASENYNNAISEYNAAIAQNADYADAHSHLCNAIALKGENTPNRKGDYDTAVAECEKAVQLSPNNAEAHSNLCNALDDQEYSALEMKGNFDHAISECRRAIQLNPNYAEAYNNLCNVIGNRSEQPIAHLNDRNEGVAACRKAIALKADYAEPHKNLGDFYRLSGDDAQAKADAVSANRYYQLATAEYRNAVTIKPRYREAQTALGTILYQANHPDDAIVELNKAAEIDPNYYGTFYWLGNVYLYEKKNYNQAAENFRKSLTLQPDLDFAEYGLSVALRAQGNAVEANQHLTRAYALNQNDKNIAADYKKYVTNQ
jgi:tetratricopeptide (TPR) repeat protein